MQIDDQVQHAIETLIEHAENDFELRRIQVLIRDLTDPPNPVVLDDNHQVFNGLTFAKSKKGYFDCPHIYLNRAVYEYYHGELPPRKFIVDYLDGDKHNNSIDNLVAVPLADFKKQRKGSVN